MAFKIYYFTQAFLPVYLLGRSFWIDEYDPILDLGIFQYSMISHISPILISGITLGHIFKNENFKES